MVLSSAVPDVSHQRTAQALQSLASHDCGAKIVRKPRKKRRKRGRVLRQLTLAGVTDQPGTEVTIIVGKKP